MTAEEYIEKINEDKNDNPEKAIKTLEEALLKYPENIELLFLKGEFHEKKDEMPAAMNVYLKILELEPNNKEAETRREFLANLLRYRNMDVFENTNLWNDPWLEE